MFITAAEIKMLTAFEEVAALETKKIEMYISRADSWIRRATGRTFPDDVETSVRDDLRIATLMLVEYLWYWDNPDVREAMMGPYEGERLGSFSVGYKDLMNMEKANPGEETGIKELDNILNFLKFKPKMGSFFRVSGPSDLP